ncbi:UDP-2,3-diacylglucosamine diphosphatase [Oryzomonas japonica]|uniref:UDP-2,3-diacylglucosamine diphosphatase n=1 Tax=Oryzomonas japonica TaxID=2603858 RepID=A0A7J4ZW21_9BACT|nr:UDP-2,3-diacylglucosamine diphosphatase [Oryzomonas japonica]KAB0667643.1 UDP-2,3-diacylglucosamine diphosphatase [Oryzomonas japonica]
MRTIFLADAHLKAPTDPNYRLLLRFLDSLKGNTETLFIMGDLFDFWVGFPSHPFRQYDAVLEALLDLTRNGCRIVYFEGNHDFHLGTIFSKHLKTEIHSGPATVMVQGKRLLLCHGDQINREDRGYRLLRFLLHNRLVASAVRHFPPSLALKVKERLQRTSQSGYQAKRKRWNYREIILTFARSAQQQGYDGLVTGHFHLAFRQELASPSFTVLSLGDWMEQFTYGEMRNGELHLCTYRP